MAGSKAKIDTPFEDVLQERVPTRGTDKGVYDHEPNLPSGMPGRDGGLLPEKTRDPITPRVPKFEEVGKTFFIK